MSEMPLINKSNEDFIGETEDALRHYAITHHPHDWTAEVWNAINRMKQSLVMENRYRMLVKQTRELLKSYDEWREPDEDNIYLCDFWLQLDKLAELVK